MASMTAGAKMQLGDPTWMPRKYTHASLTRKQTRKKAKKSIDANESCSLLDTLAAAAQVVKFRRAAAPHSS